MAVTVSCPNSMETHRVNGSGPVYSLPVRGAKDNADQTGRAKLFCGHVDHGALDITGATDLVFNGNNWCLNSISIDLSNCTPEGSGSDTYKLTLATWLGTPDGMGGIAFAGSNTLKFFVSKSMGMTCDPCGSGSGSQLPDVFALNAAPAAGVSLAAMTYEVDLAGNKVNGTTLDKPVAIELTRVLGGTCTWENPTDEHHQIKVELKCESPVARVWELQLSCQGNTLATYSVPANQWKNLGRNTLILQGTAGIDFPETLTIYPV